MLITTVVLQVTVVESDGVYAVNAGCSEGNCNFKKWTSTTYGTETFNCCQSSLCNHNLILEQDLSGSASKRPASPLAAFSLLLAVFLSAPS